MLILDTNNVLHAASKVGAGRIDAALLKQWIQTGRYRSEQIVLVFDGRGGRETLQSPVEVGFSLGSAPGGFHEVHAGPGCDADTVIESLLEHEDRLGRGRLAVVVSTDKRVRAAAAAARARSVTSEAFLRLLVEDLRSRDAATRRATGGRPDFATDEGSDAGRTEYWMRQFGLVDEPGNKSDAPRAPAEPTEAEIGAIDMESLLERSPEAPRDDEDDEPEPRGGKRPRV